MQVKVLKVGSSGGNCSLEQDRLVGFPPCFSRRRIKNHSYA
jgi:hypothetical protein